MPDTLAEQVNTVMAIRYVDIQECSAIAAVMRNRDELIDMLTVLLTESDYGTYRAAEALLARSPKGKP